MGVREHGDPFSDTKTENKGSSASRKHLQLDDFRPLLTSHCPGGTSDQVRGD